MKISCGVLVTWSPRPTSLSSVLVQLVLATLATAQKAALCNESTISVWMLRGSSGGHGPADRHCSDLVCNRELCRAWISPQLFGSCASGEYKTFWMASNPFLLSAVGVMLTHWGRVTHICVSKQTIIGSDNGLSPGRRQAIIWTNAGILLIGPLGTNRNEIMIGIQMFSFKKMHLKMLSAKWRPFCLGLNVLIWSLRFDSWSCWSVFREYVLIRASFLVSCASHGLLLKPEIRNVLYI